SYEHPDFDPVRVQVTSPTATVGYTHVGARHWAVGGILAPAENGDEKINGMPRAMGHGLVVPLVVTMKDQAYDVAPGGAYGPIRALISGVSVIHRRESDQMTAAAIGATSSVLKVDAHGAFPRPVFGTRAALGPVSLTANAKPALTKTFTG